MKKSKKVLSLLLGLSMVMPTMASCGGGSNGTQTEITVLNFGGGVGSVWLQNAIERFEAEYAEKSYADGKKGVKVTPDARMGVISDGIATAGDMIYFDESTPATNGLAASGYLLDLSDIVEPLEDKINPQVKAAMKGNDGKYYALPHYEFYFGLAYNIDVFDRYNLYLAAPEETSIVNYSSSYGAAKFISTASAKKACGVDGIYGTYDDGLPTSMQEMLILCDYMKMSKNVTPFVLSGKYTNMSIYMNTGFWASLAGYDEISTIYTFDGDVNLVTGYSTTEKMLPGMDIPKPIVSTEKIDLSTGYKVYDSAARYYSLAMLKHAMDKQWFSTGGLGGTVSHTDAQARFVLSGVNGGEEVAMLVDGSYWYSEAAVAGTFDDYKLLEQKDARVGWMPLPVSLNTTVTEGNGKTVALVESAGASCYVNGNIADKPELVAACKDFVSFCYREEELKEFTKTTGIARGMKYTMNEADFSGNTYGYTLWNMRNNGNSVVYASAENNIFRSSPGSFEITLQTQVFKPMDIEGKVRYASYYHAFKEGGMTCAQIMEQTKLSTESGWRGSYGQFFEE